MKATNTADRVPPLRTTGVMLTDEQLFELSVNYDLIPAKGMLKVEIGEGGGFVSSALWLCYEDEEGAEHWITI